MGFALSAMRPLNRVSEVSSPVTELVLGKGLPHGIFKLFSVSRPLRSLTSSIAIINRDRTNALMLAHDDSVRYKPGKLALFCDGSSDKLDAAIAVAWRHGRGRNDWHCKHYILPRGLTIGEVEFCGVIQAFHIAAQLCEALEASSKPYDTVVVYTDSKAAINYFNKFSEFEAKHTFHKSLFDLEKIAAMVTILRQADVKLELHWCPGHSGVAGNEIADRVCTAANYSRQPRVGLFSHFARVLRLTTRKLEISDVQNWKAQKYRKERKRLI